MIALTNLEAKVQAALELVNNTAGRVGSKEVMPVLESFKAARAEGYLSGAGGEWRLSPRGRLALQAIREKAGIL